MLGRYVSVDNLEHILCEVWYMMEMEVVCEKSRYGGEDFERKSLPPVVICNYKGLLQRAKVPGVKPYVLLSASAQSTAYARA